MYGEELKGYKMAWEYFLRGRNYSRPWLLLGGGYNVYIFYTYISSNSSNYANKVNAFLFYVNYSSIKLTEKEMRNWSTDH